MYVRPLTQKKKIGEREHDEGMGEEGFRVGRGSVEGRLRMGQRRVYDGSRECRGKVKDGSKEGL